MKTKGLVHPALPRVNQAFTGGLAILAIALQQWWPLALALALVLVSLLAPAFSPVGWAFRRLARPADELEPIAPVRFSQFLAVAFLGLAIALAVAGWELAAWIVAGMVAALAVLSATTGLCVGCEVYRLLLLARRGDAEDARGPLGLQGEGPWLVVLTAPGCARCEPVARALERAASRPVVRVNLRERPEAAAIPVRSVPAALAVAADGRIERLRAGALDAAGIADVVGALPAAA